MVRTGVEGRGGERDGMLSYLHVLWLPRLFGQPAFEHRHTQCKSESNGLVAEGASVSLISVRSTLSIGGGVPTARAGQAALRGLLRHMGFEAQRRTGVCEHRQSMDGVVSVLPPQGTFFTMDGERPQARKPARFSEVCACPPRVVSFQWVWAPLRTLWSREGLSI
jgi:hypothetical protein